MFWYTSAHGAASLHSFEFLVVFNAAANVENDLPQRYPKWHFNQTSILDITSQGKSFGALALFRAHAGVPFRTFKNYLGNVSISFDVVDIGGFAPQTLLRGEWRTRAGFPSAAFDGRHQGGFLAANKSAGAHAHFKIEAEVCAQNVFTEQTKAARLFHRQVHCAHGDGVLSAAVNVALPRSNRVRGNNHPLNDRVRVAFEHAAIHESTRITLICVADDILDVAGSLSGKAPLEAGGEARAASSAQLGIQNFLDDVFRAHLC